LKRLTDVVASTVGLVVLSPVLALVALAVRLSGPGPVLYRQTRVGRDGRRFGMLKFRSMVPAADQAGPLVTARGDARVTTVGRWLRRAKIDELPQLVNVLRGEMTLVGPRPEVPRYVDLYRERYAPILRHRPGITSACALALLREEHLLGEADDPERYYVDVILPHKIDAYRRELAHQSFWRDVRTLAATVLPIRGLAPDPAAVERGMEFASRRHAVADEVRASA
jgi:lipopolysaccharide/colanic/teichoic acid biosynthesis glycosyltransferase